MKVKAIIETGKNLNFDIYTDDDSLDFMLLGQGKSIEEAKMDLENSKEEMNVLILMTWNLNTFLILFLF